MRWPRIRRGILVGLGVLAVASAGAWLYRIYFTATSYALQRAESLAFRRMVIAQTDERGSYRFFLATNRSEQNDSAAIEERFGTAQARALTFGSFDVIIEPTLGLGMLINPTDWLQSREIQLQDTRLLEPGAFAGELRAIVDRAPQRTLLIVVHGFRDSFPSALRKTAFLGHVLDLNTPILVFDWPGNQGSSPRGYLRARRAAKDSAGDFAELLELIVREVAPDRVSIMANSMGGQVVVDALRMLYKGGGPAAARPLIDDVLLTAPDVDYREFNQEFRLALEALARHTTIYVSSNDRALLASRLLNRSRRLGESRLRPGQSEDLMRAIDHDPNLDPIAVVDVTPVNRTRNFHNFSLETPEFYDDVYLRLGNPRMPRHRLLYPVESTDGTVYWVLTRGR
ncbi:MAG: alpha/beta fold hydrolase [Gammaproteobacteria bacterium]|nr:alpha/beta fold hydrolase [Gammaproteobacteria bacterium]